MGEKMRKIVYLTQAEQYSALLHHAYRFESEELQNSPNLFIYSSKIHCLKGRRSFWDDLKKKSKYVGGP
jgi:hypothetical protein